MGKNFDIGRDIGADNRFDIKSGVGDKARADYSGDLAKDTGFDLNDSADVTDTVGKESVDNSVGEDLNKYSKENLGKSYTYGDYLESGEISNSFAVSAETDLNEYNSGYTNEEIRDSLDGSEGEELNKYSKDVGTEQLDAVLDNFQENKWNDLPLEEQKRSMTELADYVAGVTGNKNPPEIVFRDDMNDGEYGGYNPNTNTMEINENMLGDATEAADTVAHEMWHAHQQQCALDPTSERGREYQEGFDNYISPEYDFEGYENQMVEAEAREFAQGFRDRLAEMKGEA